MLQASRIKSSALKKLFKRGDESGIKPEWLPKVKRLLAQLNVATSPQELEFSRIRVSFTYRRQDRNVLGQHLGQLAHHIQVG